MKKIILYIQKKCRNKKSIPKKIDFKKWITKVLYKKKIIILLLSV